MWYEGKFHELSAAYPEPKFDMQMELADPEPKEFLILWKLSI